MGLVITIKDANFTNNIGTSMLPDYSIVAGEFFLKGNSVINTVTGVPCEKIGNPVTSDNSIHCGYYKGVMNGFKTDVNPPDNFSIFCVVKASAKIPSFCVAHDNSPNSFNGLLNYTNKINLFNEAYGVNLGYAEFENSPKDSWYCVGASAALNSKGKLHLWTLAGEQTTEATRVASSKRNKNGFFTIGCAEHSASGGEADFAYVLILNKALNDDEMRKQYTLIKEYFKDKNINIGQ